MGTPSLDLPELLEGEEQETEGALPWNVILYNDDVHSFNEVVFQVQKAVGVSSEIAFEITMEAHTKGQAVCYSGTRDDCEKVAAVLREIELTVEVTPAER